MNAKRQILLGSGVVTNGKTYDIGLQIISSTPPIETVLQLFLVVLCHFSLSMVKLCHHFLFRL